MVRLKVISTGDYDITIRGFQFQNGAIKSFQKDIICIVILSFNSKMVRLKVERSENDFGIPE